MDRKLVLTLVPLILFLSSSSVYSLERYSLKSVSAITSDLAAILKSGTAGSSEISVNGTTSNVTVVASKNIENYVDNDISDIDSSADKGTQSNFTAERHGPDSVYDTLTENGRTKLTSATQDITITPVSSLNRAFVLLTSYYAYGQKDITPTSSSGGKSILMLVNSPPIFTIRVLYELKGIAGQLMCG